MISGKDLGCFQVEQILMTMQSSVKILALYSSGRKQICSRGVRGPTTTRPVPKYCFIRAALAAQKRAQVFVY